MDTEKKKHTYACKYTYLYLYTSDISYLIKINQVYSKKDRFFRPGWRHIQPPASYAAKNCLKSNSSRSDGSSANTLPPASVGEIGWLVSLSQPYVHKLLDEPTLNPRIVTFS